MRLQHQAAQDRQAAHGIGERGVAPAVAAAGEQPAPAAVAGQPERRGEARDHGEPGQGEGGVAVAVRARVQPHGGAERSGREHRVLEHPEPEHARQRLLAAGACPAQGAVVQLEAALRRASEPGAETGRDDAHGEAEAEPRAAVHARGALQCKGVGDVGEALGAERRRQPQRVDREERVEDATVARQAAHPDGDVVRGHRAEHEEDRALARAPDAVPGSAHPVAAAAGRAFGWCRPVVHGGHGESPAAHLRVIGRGGRALTDRCRSAIRPGMVASPTCF